MSTPIDDQTQSGIAHIGPSPGKNLVVAIVKFPYAFRRAPVVTANTLQAVDETGIIDDTFAVSITQVVPEGFRVNVFRVDNRQGIGWAQSLRLGWTANLAAS